MSSDDSDAAMTRSRSGSQASEDAFDFDSDGSNFSGAVRFFIILLRYHFSLPFFPPSLLHPRAAISGVATRTIQLFSFWCGQGCQITGANVCPFPSIPLQEYEIKFSLNTICTFAIAQEDSGDDGMDQDADEPILQVETLSAEVSAFSLLAKREEKK